MDGLRFLVGLILIPGLSTRDQWPDETTVQSMENDTIRDMDEAALTSEVQWYIRDLISALKSTRQSRLNCRAKRDELRAQMEAKEEVMKTLRRQKRTLKGRVKELKLQVRILRSDGDALHDAEIARYRNEAIALRAAVESLSRRLARRETELVETRAERTDLRWRLDLTKSQLEDSKQENEELREGNNELQYHIDVHDIDTF